MSLEDVADPKFVDLVEMVRFHAESSPDVIVFKYLLDGESDEETLTFRELDDQVRKIAARLQSTPGADGRVLLLYPPGLDYIRGLLACFYAGSIAVPTYPPDITRLDRTMPRFLSIVSDAQPAIALTTSPILAMAQSFLSQYAELDGVEWLASDEILVENKERSDDWTKPDITPDSIAFLQYTSGSTAAPRGVILTHKNLLSNLDAICCAFDLNSDDHAVFWLPFYHDMGLIGGILAPIYCGIENLLFSPLDFLQRPLRWLKALSRSKATVSGGPNFAYDLAARKVTSEQKAELDLSNWTLAFNGAEPVRADTLRRFADAFAECGFDPDAFYPAYGLAEATLFVTGGMRSAYPLVEAFDQESLMHGTVLPVDLSATKGDERDKDSSQVLVSCGTPRKDIEVCIVDPTSREELARSPEGSTDIGEIWVGGKSIAQGYWNRPEETDEIFNGTLAEHTGTRFMRTGDLGFLFHGELFISGRLKDLIIIDGLNHYPQDIELTVEWSHAALRPGCSAAFSIESADREQLVVVAEIAKPKKLKELQAAEHGEITPQDVKKSIIDAVTRRHDLRLHDVLLLKPGTVPKTSSGKIQRHACKNGYLEGSLEIWAG